MPVYEVTHEDGRKTKVIDTDRRNESTESRVKKQANHHETSRIVIANRTGMPAGPDASLAVSIKKIKD